MLSKPRCHVSNTLSQNSDKVLAFYFTRFGMIIPKRHNNSLILIEQGTMMMKINIPQSINRSRLLTTINPANVATIRPIKAQSFRQIRHLITAQEIAHA